MPSRLPLLFLSSRVNRQQPATGENTAAARSPALFFGKTANHQRNSMRRLLRLKIPVMQRRSIEFFKYGALLRDGSSTDPSKFLNLESKVWKNLLEENSRRNYFAYFNVVYFIHLFLYFGL